MTRTYSEQRQAVYFKAARELRKIAGQILDECQNEFEFRGDTATWVKNQARITAERATVLEDLGHEQCVATPQAESHNWRSKSAYSAAVTRFQERALAVGPEILAKVNAA